MWAETVGGYLVSDDGQIYSPPKLIRSTTPQGKFMLRRVGGRIMNGNISPDGYKRVKIGGKIMHVHTLVADAYLDKPFGADTVNHKDGIKTNNRVENLEWVSNSENMKHAWETGLCDARMAVICIDTGEVYASIHEAARRHGLAAGNLCSTLKGRQKTFAGCRWEYAA